MKANEIMEQIRKAGKGQFAGMTWQKDLPTRKGVQHKVSKVSQAVVRFGVEYENLKSTKEGREDGTLPEQNTGLPWGQWKQYPYIIENKGNEYLRCTLGANNKIKTSYFIDGNPATKEEVQVICLKSAFSSGAPQSVMNINVENITTLHTGKVEGE